MNYDLLQALVAFAFVTSITPGPNNLMLMASGANFGFRPSIPHMLGIGFGFTVMIILVGFGLAQIFDYFPMSHMILKVISVLYLLFLAWKISNASPPAQASDAGRPITFLQAALFQWVNPKAWSMALTSIGAYSPTQDMWGVFWVAAVFGAINLPCVSCWTIFGQQMRRFLTNQKRLRIYNWSMAGLLILTLYPVLAT
jgi:threonine/homoserine/homoserine lactone efflux protein